MLRILFALAVILLAIMLAVLLAGCTLVVETRSSAECKPQEGCKAESSLNREGRKDVNQ